MLLVEFPGFMLNENVSFTDSTVLLPSLNFKTLSERFATTFYMSCARSSPPEFPGETMADLVQILIVDDDAELRELVVERLTNYGLSAFAVQSGEAMFAELATRKYDLILLDVMMPGEDGLSLCRRLRSTDSPTSHIPVIFLTALGETTDKVVGLELGGDDYLPKPFQTRELIARIRAVLRRTQSPVQQALPSEETANASPISNKKIIWHFGNWRLNPLARHLIDDKDAVIPLSATEFRLLLFFLERPQQVLNRDQILDYTTGRSADVFDRSIDVQISRLRSKLRDNGKNPEIIRTMRGDGYMLTLPVSQREEA